MKKLVLLFASLFIIVITAQNVNAQNEQTASAEASATIISPMTIENTLPLLFGNIAAGTTDGTVTLTPEGNRTASNVKLSSVTGEVQPATFVITGLAGSKFALRLPASAKLISGDNVMTVTGFSSDTNEILEEGTETFNVGATLNVKASQAVGTYAGTFDVTVDYN